jgi:hypothetical protein
MAQTIIRLEQEQQIGRNNSKEIHNVLEISASIELEFLFVCSVPFPFQPAIPSQRSSQLVLFAWTSSAYLDKSLLVISSHERIVSIAAKIVNKLPTLSFVA